jgi:hypothetical protein
MRSKSVKSLSNSLSRLQSTINRKTISYKTKTKKDSLTERFLSHLSTTFRPHNSDLSKKFPSPSIKIKKNAPTVVLRPSKFESNSLQCDYQKAKRSSISRSIKKSSKDQRRHTTDTKINFLILPSHRRKESNVSISSLSNQSRRSTIDIDNYFLNENQLNSKALGMGQMEPISDTHSGTFNLIKKKSSKFYFNFNLKKYKLGTLK